MPIVVGPTILGPTAVVNDPAAIRRVFVDVTPVQRMTLRPKGGMPMILRRRDYYPASAQVARLYPDGRAAPMS